MMIEQFATGGLEPEQQQVDQRMAEMELHRQLYNVHYANTRYLQVYAKDNCFNKVVSCEISLK
jgi:hypothetical protein